MDDLGFRWQLGGHLFLGAAQQERFYPTVEVLQSYFAGALFNRDAVIAVEAFHVAEPARQEEMKQRPEFTQVVFQRRTAQAQALAGVQLAGSLGGLAVGVLDVLRFIQHQDVQRLRRQALDVLGQQRVGGQDQVVVGQVVEMLFAAGAVQRQHLELRGEVRGFVEPVGNQAGGHHHHAGAIEAPGVLLAEHVRQGLQGFAQAHVIGEDAADFQLPQRLHPAQAFKLIRAQGCIQAVRSCGGVVLDVAQALGKGADLLATFPEQRQVFQRIEARGVGLAQAQCGFTRLLQVKLAERRQYRFQAAEGQGDLQGAVLGVGPVGNVDQDQLVVAPPGQALRVEQFGVGAHQVQQDRQQAQPLAIDDDPQFQVEPVPFRRLFDRGVPVVHGGQVEAEVLVDQQFPALGAQLRQFIEGEGQPGAVIDHLIQFPGAFRQGLALPGGDFEAEDSQLFAVGLFHVRVAFYPQGLGFLANQDVGILLA
ncbi:hypothetical protein D3C76_690740 [compost metagenome]